jgi:apolipoprotein N-acyltransferase
VLGWIGFVPWLAVLDGAKSMRTTLVAASAMCVAFTVAVFGWFAQAIATYTGISLGVAALLLIAGAPLLQPQFIAFALVRRVVRARAGLAYAVLAAAFAYVGTEWAWPKLFGDTIGHGFYASPLLRQAADLAGAHGFTFVLIVANECARIAGSPAQWRAGVRRPVVAAACVLVMAGALAAYGRIRIDRLQPQPAMRLRFAPGSYKPTSRSTTACAPSAARSRPSARSSTRTFSSPRRLSTRASIC